MKGMREGSELKQWVSGGSEEICEEGIEWLKWISVGVLEGERVEWNISKEIKWWSWWRRGGIEWIRWQNEQRMHWSKQAKRLSERIDIRDWVNGVCEGTEWAKGARWVSIRRQWVSNAGSDWESGSEQVSEWLPEWMIEQRVNEWISKWVCELLSVWVSVMWLVNEWVKEGVSEWRQWRKMKW